jgi:hypothetical protein
MAELISDEMLDVFTVTGSWDEIAGKMKSRYEGVFDRIAFYIPCQPGRDVEKWQKVISPFAE